MPRFKDFVQEQFIGLTGVESGYELIGANAEGDLVKINHLLIDTGIVAISDTVPTNPITKIWIKTPDYKQYIRYTEGANTFWIEPSKESVAAFSWFEWFDFLWIGNYDGDNLVNEVGDNVSITNNDIVTAYIPDTSTATFGLPAPYADFNTANLVELDYDSLVVKYDNTEPHHVRMIGILKDSFTPTTDQLNQLHQLFELYVYWSGVYNDYGVLKSNRVITG